MKVDLSVQQTISNNVRRSVHFASVLTIFMEPDVFFIVLHLFWPHDAMLQCSAVYAMARGRPICRFAR